MEQEKCIKQIRFIFISSKTELESGKIGSFTLFKIHFQKSSLNPAKNNENKF